MANIREIAKLAGVSVATVSRVLNHHPYVSEEKKTSVYRAIESLNYKRNLNAVHLSKGISNRVGVVLPTIDHPYFSSIVQGIADTAMNHGRQLILTQTNYDISKELEALELLKANLVDGLIICSRAISIETIMQYKEYGPIVLCEDSDQNVFSSISIPHADAFSHGLDYLISKGHTKIGYCLGRMNGSNSIKRQKAYEMKMREINQEINTEWFFNNCLSIEDGNEVIKKYIHLDEKPTALLVGNDQVAAGILLSAQTLNMKIPGDLAILSFDNQPISRIMNISTIEIPTKEMGKLATQYILNIETPSHTNKKIILPYKLIERLTV